MLTPSKKIIESPFQTPSPIRQQPWSKRKSPSSVDKENYTTVKSPKCAYDLIPVEDCTQFVWTKKVKRDRKRKHGQCDNEENRRNLIEEHRKELEQLKKRRLERELIHEQRMKEKEDLIKLNIAGEFENWEKEEHAFMLRQAKERTKLRLKAGRPQPIDLLVQYKENGNSCPPSNYPINLIARLSTCELGDLAEDIKVYKEIDGVIGCVYWEDVLNVVNKYLNDNHETHRRDGINQAVSSDVNKILSGKTSNQLMLLRSQIKEKMSSGNTDTSFWESLLDNLTFFLSFASLSEMQENVSLKDVQHISGQDAENVKSVRVKNVKSSQSDVSKEDIPKHISDPSPLSEDVGVVHLRGVKVTTLETNKTGVNQESKLTEFITPHYIRRDIDIFEEKYSPKYLKESELDKGAVITDPVEDMKRLTLARQRVREMYSRNEQPDDSSDSDGDSSFANEYNLLHQSYSWDTKYKPRKPRYFNRVIAGFVWNRYNRTHYDIDNPPPKTVRGYKFNIFYPDLIDKNVTPVYSITPDTDDTGLDIIRFRAGPPYEDVAFKIVRGNWNMSVKRGYKCSFNGRVLELWFHFRHMCYRR